MTDRPPEEPILVSSIYGPPHDIYQAIYWQEFTHSVDFEVKRAVGCDEDGPVYMENGNVISFDEAPIFLRGSVRFDGCSNFDFPESRTCMIHCCDRDSMVSIGTLLGRVFDQCAAIMADSRVLLDRDIGQQQVVENKLPWRKGP